MINVVYTVNDAFIQQLATGICSVCENNKCDKIKFYVISDGITESNKQKLTNFVNEYNQYIEIIELGNIRDYLDFEFDIVGWSSIVLARLVISKLLPATVKRVIYLDGDTMVRGSLRGLWDTDMGDSIIGASVEPTANFSRKIGLGIPADSPYYNAGVLLIDLDKWRNEHAERRILSYYKEHEGKLFANDQDAINGEMQHDIYSLSIVYNFCNSYRFYPYRTLVKIMKPCPFISKEEYKKCISNPIIIHFLGEERPWRIGNKNPFTHEYFKYWNKTPWADMPLESGWEKYFVAFNLFNVVMKISPYIRYKIIDACVPWVLRQRSKKKK